jgi:hypothetical protein
MLHILIHFLVPTIAAFLLYRMSFLKSCLIVNTTMLVDLDHLLADPIFDPNRCSIGFHPLHTLPVIVVYVLMIFLPKTRLIGIGLTIHMLLDYLDCVI